MKKFFKVLFIIIALAAIAGCIFFGYHYFKKDGETPPPTDPATPPPAVMTLDTAKELVYTAAYDLGGLTASAFELEIGKAPLSRVTNMNEPYEYNISFDDISTFTYKPYTSDNVVMTTYEYQHYPFEVNRVPSTLKVLHNFFQYDAIQENQCYNLALGQWNSIHVFSYDLVSDTELTVYVYNHVEMVFKYKILNKTDSGITDYSLTVYTRDDSDASQSERYNREFAVTYLEVKTSNNIKRVEKYSYVFVVLTDLTVENIFVLDVDIVNDKMIFADPDIFNADPSTKTTIGNKVKNVIATNTHENSNVYYENVTKTDLQ